MNTTTFLVLVAVAFQCFVQHNEAANIGQLRRGLEASPEELLNELRTLVSSSVEDGIKTLTSTLEDSKSKVSGIQDDAKVQLGKEKEGLLKEFDEIKSKAKSANKDQCVAGDDGQIEYFFNTYKLQTDYCAYYFLNTVDGGFKAGVDKLQTLKDLEPQLRKELEDCGDAADCKDKVAGEVSKAIEEVPEKVKTTIENTTKLIGLSSLNECEDEQIQKFHDGVEYIFKVANECIDKKE